MGTGALHVAILSNLDRMQLLLEHGADVNEKHFCLFLHLPTTTMEGLTFFGRLLRTVSRRLSY